MAPKEKERDWDKELAEVDRLLNKLPSVQEEKAAQAAAARRAAPDHGGGRAQELSDVASSRQWLGTWARMVLSYALGIAMFSWPYSHACGARLFVYLGGVGVVIIAGVWSSLSSWKRRLGLAHLFSQGLVMWGLWLALREILPRVGYAKDVATWFCP